MKRAILFAICSLFLLSTGLLKSQTFLDSPIIPYQTNASPIFGKDIVIHDQPDRDQRNIAVCSAFNGWLYAVYSYKNGYFLAISILRSTDNGVNWDVLGEGTAIAGSSTTKLDIMTCGNSIDNLKIFVGFVYFDSLDNVGGAYLPRYKAEPFGFENGLLEMNSGDITDMAISNDYPYPCPNSNPFSIAVVYSKTGISKTGLKDSIIFRSSSDGGMSLNNRKVLAISDKKFKKVALAFGRSPSWSNGRYFAAWEEQEDVHSNIGHIYTAHSEPNFNSPFTTPLCIDSLDTYSINRARNPVIACQFSDTDNDSANLTEVVMFEKYIPNLAKYDLAGYYNLQATKSNYFKNFSVSPTQNNKQQPDINFNPYNSTFMVTYFDSTDHKLPFLTNDVNLTNPDSWSVVSSGYNDSANISSPYPKVKLNTLQQKGMNVWIADKPNGNGIALFDAPYNTYTGVSEINKTEEVKLYSAYPNPCISFFTICFELQKMEYVTISLHTVMGQQKEIITDQYYSSGKHYLKFNSSNLSPGSYYYSVKSEEFFASEKIIVIR